MAESREFQFTNFARSTLSSELAAGATTLFIESNDQHKFPNADGAYDEIFAGILISPDESTIEIVYCTARLGNSLTVERGKELTTAQDWVAGSTFVHNFTAQLAQDIVEGGSRLNGLILVGLDGILILTLDGVTFERIAFFGASYDWWAVAYSPDLNRCVAVGEGLRGRDVAYSDDGGYTWYLEVDALSAAVRHPDIIWSDQFQLFISCSNPIGVPDQTASVAWSEDGLTWTDFDTTSICQQATGLGFNGLVDIPAPFSKPGIYACHGIDYAYSDDGKTWVNIDANVALGVSSAGLGGMAFGNGVMVAGSVSTSGGFPCNTNSSPDGINFSEVAAPLGDNSDLTQNTWMANISRFVGTCPAANVPTGFIAYSSDGVNWTAVPDTEVPDRRWRNSIYSDKLGVVFLLSSLNTPATALMKSSDGILYSDLAVPAELGNNSHWKGGTDAVVPVLRDKQDIVMVEDSPTTTEVCLSEDGYSFRPVDAFQNVAEKSVAFSPTLGTQGRYCSVGLTGNINTSDDAGATWNNQTSPDTSTYQVVIWSASLGLFIAGADDSLISENIVTSPDGFNWTPRTTGPGFDVHSLADDGNGNLVAGGYHHDGPPDNMDALFSDDGINWTVCSSVATTGGLGVSLVQWDTFRSRFIALDVQDEEVYVSTDLGDNWTDISSNLPGTGHNIQYSTGNTLLQLVVNRLVLSTSSGILTSDDGGVTWVERLVGINQRRGLIQIATGRIINCGNGAGVRLLHSLDNGTTWLIGSDPLGNQASTWINLVAGNITEIP